MERVNNRSTSTIARVDYLLQNVEPDGVGGVTLPALEVVETQDAREA